MWRFFFSCLFVFMLSFSFLWCSHYLRYFILISFILLLSSSCIATKKYNFILHYWATAHWTKQQDVFKRWSLLKKAERNWFRWKQEQWVVCHGDINYIWRCHSVYSWRKSNILVSNNNSSQDLYCTFLRNSKTLSSSFGAWIKAGCSGVGLSVQNAAVSTAYMHWADDI